MAVYYFEGSPIVAPLKIESNEPIFVTDSISLKQQRASQGAQRWELEFTVMTRDVEEDLFVSSIVYANQARTMVMPQLLSVDNKTTCSVAGTVSATATVASSTVSITFSEIGTTIPKGSFIKFSNHPKLYLVTSEVTTTGSPVVVSIFPVLREEVTSGVTVNHPGSPTKPMFTYYQSTDNVRGIIYEDGVLVNPGTIKLLEALQ